VLGPVVDALATDSVDLSRVRVVCDWVQYRSSFRDVVEFGRKGYEDLQVIQRFGGDRALGLGVVDVKSEQIESAELIAQRILKARETFPADKLIINPDCGLRHLPADAARSKLAAMVEGTAAVRRTLPHQSGHTQLAESHDQTVTSPELTVEQGA